MQINRFLNFWKSNLIFLFAVIISLFLFAFKYFFRIGNGWLFVFYCLGSLISLIIIWLDQDGLVKFYQEKGLESVINSWMFILVLPILIILLLTSQSGIGFAIGFNIYLFILMKMFFFVSSENDFNQYFTEQLKRDLNSVEIKTFVGLYILIFFILGWIFLFFNF